MNATGFIRLNGLRLKVVAKVHNKIIFPAVIVVCGCNLIASPIDDLASPKQETRDAAAKILRTTYVPPSRTNWDSLVSSVKLCANKTNVLAKLKPFNAKEESGAGSGNSETLIYRLDDRWTLDCSYIDGSGKFLGCDLVERVRNIWALPPTNFSGVWVTYWINGQNESAIHIKNGKYFGEFTGFYSDGERAYVQHYDEQGANGDDTGFFKSGKIKYRGQYKANVLVGIWVWYNEDGTTNSVKDFSKH